MIVERNNARPARWITWLGLILVPVLVAGVLFAATWNGDPRQVEAAIVNLDEPVTIDDQYIPLGRQLTAALVDSDRVENLTWLQASEADARSGLATGRYAAMVVIPADFSAAATSYGGDAEVRRATIQVETSPVAGIADATLGKVVAHTAATTLNETLTSTYLDQIYLGFDELGDNFVTMADGAGELADGAEKLADGIEEAADGSVQLSDGADQLSDGLRTMAGSTASLPRDVRKLANGTGELAGGVKQYVGGVDQLVDQTLASLDQQAQLVAGVAQLSDGAGALAGGLQQYRAAMGQLAENPELVTAATAAAGQQAQSQAVRQALQGAAGQAAAAATGPAQQAAAQEVPCPSDIAAIPDGCAIFEAGRAAGVQVGVAAGSQAGAEAGLQVGLGVGVPVGVGAAGQAASQGLGAADQPKSLLGGSQALAGGLSELRQQLSAAGGGGDPSEQLGQLKTAGRQLVGGTAELAKGTDQLADGIPQLVDGISRSADGAGQLADGMNEFSDGLGEAAEGSRKLADGAREMADGIAEGKDKLPSYSETERQNLAEVVAAPISTENLQGTAGAGIGWATLLMVLALWAGALATFVVVRAVGSRLLGSARSSAYLVAEALVPGVIVVSIQAIVVTAIGQVALQLPFGRLFGMLGLMLVAGLAFAAVNHALVAWFGGAGRLVSLALAVLSLASMVTAAEPGVFGLLRVFSPLTPALDASRALLTESTGVATNLFLMIAWLIAGVAASAVAIVRNRTTDFATLLAEHGA